MRTPKETRQDGAYTSTDVVGKEVKSGGGPLPDGGVVSHQGAGSGLGGEQAGTEQRQAENDYRQRSHQGDQDAQRGHGQPEADHCPASQPAGKCPRNGRDHPGDIDQKD